MGSSSSNSVARDGVGQRFLDDGYLIAPAEDRAALDSIRQRTAAAAAAALKIPTPNDVGDFLDRFHERIEPSRLNEVRLAILTQLLNDSEFRALYFACGRGLVEGIAGTELAMQRTMGLSIQLPGDDSSLLPLHSDTWGSECSPFEVVQWVPLVDCARTKSMFILPPAPDRRWRGRYRLRRRVRGAGPYVGGAHR